MNKLLCFIFNRFEVKHSKFVDTYKTSLHLSQEAGSWFYEILLVQFPLVFLPMVLCWWAAMWIRSVSYFRIESMEKLVRAFIFLLDCEP